MALVSSYQLWGRVKTHGKIINVSVGELYITGLGAFWDWCIYTAQVKKKINSFRTSWREKKKKCVRPSRSLVYPVVGLPRLEDFPEERTRRVSSLFLWTPSILSHRSPHNISLFFSFQNPPYNLRPSLHSFRNTFYPPPCFGATDKRGNRWTTGAKVFPQRFCRVFL